MEDNLNVTEHMQAVVEQMRLDDIEENPAILNDFFDCDCCGQNKCFAGSIQYGDYRLCNDCVLYAELGFELKKLNSIEELIEVMEDKRLEEICEFIKNDSTKNNN